MLFANYVLNDSFKEVVCANRIEYFFASKMHISSVILHSFKNKLLGEISMKIVALFPESVAGEDNQLLNTERAIGLKPFLEEKGHEFVILTDNEADLDKHLADMDIVISAPFYSAYMTKERIEKAPNLKLVITAGVGSDHVDLQAASEHNIGVVEVTGSNTISVAEHAVMDLLILLRNYEEGHRQAKDGEWNLSKVGNHVYELQK